MIFLNKLASKGYTLPSTISNVSDALVYSVSDTKIEELQ